MATSTVESGKQTRTIPTTAGPVLAEAQADLIHARGIPFATAQRFAAPQALPPWTDVRDCTKPGPLCPQLPFRLEFVLGERDKADRVLNEDCLCLTVVAPASATAASKLPVIVWYHGGANIAGGADIDIMDTSELARRGVVVVSVQYRLGVLGCLAIDGIAPANLHVLDQIAALQWVHAHVGAFGGDAAQVTLQGQSAGGCAVYNLLFADGTEHLYQRAVLQSAPLGILHGAGKDAALTAARAKELLGGSAAAAAAKSSDEILDVQRTLVDEQKARGGTIGFWPSWGAHPLPPATDLDARIALLAKQKDLFIGWTADDCMPFIQLSPYAPALNALPLVGSWAKLAISKLATNYVFKRGSQQLHQKWLRAGGRSTSFVFEWYPAGSPLRACHCIDMPFLFADWPTWANAPLVAYGEGSREIVERLAPEVRDVFVHFAKNGLKSNAHIVINERFSKAEWVK